MAASGGGTREETGERLAKGPAVGLARGRASVAEFGRGLTNVAKVGIGEAEGLLSVAEI